MDVSIIVVSYNTRQMTLDCLESIFSETTDSTFEIIVVDNMSSDGSPDAIRAKCPDVRLIEPRSNLGFAKANNLAAASARGRYLLLLNPDTIVLEAAIDKLVRFAQTYTRKAIFGARTVHADHSLNPTSCWGRPTLWSTFCLALGLSVLGKYVPLFDRETMRHWKRNSTREVDIISGCCLMTSREVWNDMEGFDPDFVMYGEDFDFCLRAREKGIPCLFYHDAWIVHYGSASEAVKPNQLVRQMRAKVQLINKHWRTWRARIGIGLIKTRVFLRAYMLSGLGSKGDDNKSRTAAAWREAWVRRGEWLK